MHLTLPCDSSQEIFPDNSIGDYRVKLPYEVNLERDRYSVGLTSVQFPHTFNIIGPCKIAVQRGALDPNEVLAEADLPGFYCESIEECIQKLNTAIETLFSSIPDPLCRFRINITTGQVVLKRKVSSDRTHIYLRLSCNILQKLGFDENQHIEVPQNCCLCWIKSNTFATHPHSIHPVTGLMIHCDLIQPARPVIGQTSRKTSEIIRAIPVNSNYGESVNYEPNNIQFFPLKHNSFSEVRITFTDSHNNPLNFLYGRVIVNLYLKKCI